MTEIFDYYNKRNKSKTYSTKLLGEFRAIMRLILSSPRMGIKTEDENIRYVLSGNYALFYEIKSCRGLDCLGLQTKSRAVGDVHPSTSLI